MIDLIAIGGSFFEDDHECDHEDDHECDHEDDHEGDGIEGGQALHWIPSVKIIHHSESE